MSPHQTKSAIYSINFDKEPLPESLYHLQFQILTQLISSIHTRSPIFNYPSYPSSPISLFNFPTSSAGPELLFYRASSPFPYTAPE
jgi:hypothetical protein